MHMLKPTSYDMNEQSMHASLAFGMFPGQFLEKTFDYVRQAKLDDRASYRWGWATNANRQQYSGIDVF